VILYIISNFDIIWKPIDVQEVEECVKLIIEKIEEKDPDQFNALLESIKKKQTITK